MTSRDSTVLMVAYTHYSCDPRVKSYVKTLQGAGVDVRVWALDEAAACAPELVRYGKKYQGASLPRYLLRRGWTTGLLARLLDLQQRASAAVANHVITADHLQEKRSALAGNAERFNEKHNWQRQQEQYLSLLHALRSHEALSAA